MRTAIRTLALALVMAVVACGGRAAMGDGDREAATFVEVENQATLDMTVYVIRGAGDRTRLGTVTAHTTRRLRIPPRLIFGITELRFQADPVGSQRAPVTQSITVEPGDTIVLRIPPF